MATENPLRLHDADAIRAVKQAFAPDGGAEREHNAGADSLGFGALHHSLVANLPPRRALVIGSRYGFVPAVVGLAMQAGGGELDLVDANYDDSMHGFQRAFGGVGHWSEAGCGRFAQMGAERRSSGAIWTPKRCSRAMCWQRTGCAAWNTSSKSAVTGAT